MVFDGQVRGGGIVHAEQHAERFDARIVALEYFDIAVFQRAGATQAGAHVHAGPAVFGFFQCQLRILYGLFGGNQCKLAEAFDAGKLYLGKMRGRVEIFYGCGDAYGELLNEVFFQAFDSRVSLHQTAEKLPGRRAQR